MNIHTMGQFAKVSLRSLLYKEFGVDAEILLIMHGALSQQPLQILRPMFQSHSASTAQVFDHNRDMKAHAHLFKEMVEALTLELVTQCWSAIGIYITGNRGPDGRAEATGDYRSWRRHIPPVAVLRSSTPLTLEMNLRQRFLVFLWRARLPFRKRASPALLLETLKKKRDRVFRTSLFSRTTLL